MAGGEWVLAVTIVLLTSGGQLLLKTGANTDRHLIFNPFVFAGYGMFVVVLLLSAVLLRTVDLKHFSVIVGMNYVVASLLAMALLRERVTLRRLSGCVLASIGAVVFSL
jgi:drug/metabolite transporter (DMT)-like permease